MWTLQISAVSSEVPDGSPQSQTRDITFEETGTGFEIWYSDRIANEHRGLVDESADWLERVMGVLNLGQIDYKVLMADGALTDQLRSGLIGWWTSRLEDLDL